MITNFLVTGDLHGKLDRFINLHLVYNPAETAIICLGDCGFNFYLNKNDQKLKQQAEDLGFTFYCLRGNHEARPEDIPTMSYLYDPEVNEYIYMETQFPHIRYLVDGGLYNFNGTITFTIGGAYSVDKWYRILRAGYTEENNNPKVTGWFANEMLSENERNKILTFSQNLTVDLVLTHTCPLPWEPTDLFLSAVDQSKVDKTMEKFLDSVQKTVNWKIWLFGHYHDDRLVRPGVEMYYTDIEPLQTVVDRWNDYAETGEVDWWLKKDPNFYYEGDTH